MREAHRLRWYVRILQAAQRQVSPSDIQERGRHNAIVRQLSVPPTPRRSRWLRSLELCQEAMRLVANVMALTGGHTRDLRSLRPHVLERRTATGAD
jgi:hypothetical protein